MTDALYPYFAQLRYHSPYAPHVQTVALNEISTTGLGDPGTIEPWVGAAVATDTAIEAFIDLLADMNDADVVYDGYTLFKIPTVGAVAQPFFEKAYNAPGTATLTGSNKATSMCISFRTTNFGLMKLYALDRANADTWGNVYTPDALVQAVVDYVISDASVLRGHDNGRPLTFTNLSFSLNKRLRREYRMI